MIVQWQWQYSILFYKNDVLDSEFVCIDRDFLVQCFGVKTVCTAYELRHFCRALCKWQYSNDWLESQQPVEIVYETKLRVSEWIMIMTMLFDILENTKNGEKEALNSKIYKTMNDFDSKWQNHNEYQIVSIGDSIAPSPDLHHR